MPLTIYDISKRAGVSIATVSRVLNGSDLVSAKTRQRVLAVMEECGYTPNIFARGLGPNTMKTVGLLCANVSDPPIARAVFFLQRFLRQAGYDCMLLCTEDDLEVRQKYMELMLNKRVDAMILCGSHFVEERPEDNGYILRAAEKMPVMLLIGALDAPGVYSLLPDDRDATRRAVGMLLDTGSRQVLYLCHALSYAGQRKLEGYREAHAQRGMEAREELILPCLEGLTGEALLHSVADKLAALTERGVAFDGLAASSDALAVAALKALTAAGVKVPESVQVVGYDHTDLSLACTPALTTVDTCAEEMCRRCVDTMMDVLVGRKFSRHPPGNHAISKKGGIPLQRQAVLFDLGWTLVVPRSGDWMLTPLFEQTFPAWREAISPAEMERAQQRPAAYLAENHRLTTLTQEVAQITRWYELLGEALPALGMTPAKAAALAEDHTYNVAGNYTLLPGVREMLESLARQGYALGVISDTWPSVELQLPAYGIDHLLDARTFSFALGAFKPHASLYRDALEQLGLPGNACWFVDDRPCNLVGAEQAGMRGVQSLAEPGARADGRFPAIKAPTELPDLLAGKPATDAWAAYQETLTEKDLPAMMALQAEMAAALPSPRWYFTSKEEEFAQEVRAGRVLGLRVNGELAAFAIACPARDNAKSYAAILGRDEPDSLDFQDIMVSPRYRRRGMHSYFLALYEQQARAAGMTALYATVDPENLPSLRSFEKAGWVRVDLRNAYDGRIRAYYRKGL